MLNPNITLDITPPKRDANIVTIGNTSILNPTFLIFENAPLLNPKSMPTKKRSKQSSILINVLAKSENLPISPPKNMPFSTDDKIKKYPTAVIHTINGILTEEDFEALKDNDLKVLVLGYKDLRRGVDYHDNNRDEIEKNQEWLSKNLSDFLCGFDTVSFDNLGLEQLPVRNLMTEEEWDSFYMGDDGGYTFYIDCVANTFSKNSISLERFQLMDNIDDMFQKILSLN